MTFPAIKTNAFKRFVTIPILTTMSLHTLWAFFSFISIPAVAKFRMLAISLCFRKIFVRINYTLCHHIISFEHWRISLFNIPRFRCIRPYIQEFHMLFPCIHCSIDIQMVYLHNDRTHMSFFSHILYSLDPSIQDGTLEY